MPGANQILARLLSPTATALLISTITLAATGPVNAKVRVVPFAKSGSWSVNAIYDRAGPFNHCSASATYRSGTRVALIAYATGVWKLQFYKRNWPVREEARFPARLVVDGKTVLTGNGKFKGRSAFIDIGRSSKRVIALMRGRVMSIHTPSGTSSFRLDGTFKATVQLAKCWKANNRAPSGNAFSNNQSGAFGNNATRPGRSAFGDFRPKIKSGTQVMTRGQTLDLATTYLSGLKRPYSLLPRNKNVLKHFPVNWRFENGVLGGMKVYTRTPTSSVAMLQRLLAQQAAKCKGRSATEREDALVLKSGRKVQRARGICELKSGSVLDLRYRVTELGSRMLMVVMHVGAKRVGGPSSSGRKPGAQDL